MAGEAAAVEKIFCWMPLVDLFFSIYRQIRGIAGLKNKISPLRSALKGVILVYDNIID